MSANLTEIQSKVLEALRGWFRLQPIPPTLQELANLAEVKHLGTVLNALRRLQTLGYVTLTPNKSRSVMLVGHAHVENDSALQLGHQMGLGLVLSELGITAEEVPWARAVLDKAKAYRCERSVRNARGLLSVVWWKYKPPVV